MKCTVGQKVYALDGSCDGWIVAITLNALGDELVALAQSGGGRRHYLKANQLTLNADEVKKVQSGARRPVLGTPWVSA